MSKNSQIQEEKGGLDINKKVETKWGGAQYAGRQREQAETEARAHMGTHTPHQAPQPTQDSERHV